MTVISASSRAIWNERTSPRRATRSGRQPVMSVPSNRMRPLSGLWTPVMRSNVVDFPAPFGPMRPVILPGATSNVAPSTAWIPPKPFCSCSTARIGSAVVVFSLGSSDSLSRSRVVSVDCVAVTARPPRVSGVRLSPPVHAGGRAAPVAVAASGTQAPPRA